MLGTLKNLFEYIWDHIVRTVKDFYNFIRYDVPHGIANFIKWAPVIYEDRWWDHAYLFRLLQKKLQLMEKGFVKYGIALDSEKVAKQIRTCHLLLKRLTDDEYGEMAFKRYEEIYGDRSDLLFKGDPLLHDESAREKRDKHFRRCIEHEDMLRRQDLEYLCKMIRKHSLKWWD
jgi:hypothetical protein